MTASTSQHPDEERVVGDHHQTEHKLDLIRPYFGAYSSIIARARNIPNNRDCWIVDTHAGAGCTGAVTIWMGVALEAH
jgi:hypothetical protein